MRNILLGKSFAGVRHIKAQDSAYPLISHRNRTLRSVFASITEEIGENLCQPILFRMDHTSDRRQMANQIDTILHTRLIDLLQVIEYLGQVDCRIIEIHLPGFDLRKVENIIDQLEQKLIIRLDDLDIFTDLIRLFRHRNQVREADNRV